MVRLENERFPKIDLALESIDSHNNILDEHDERITAVELDVEKHEIQIGALQRA